METFTKKGKTFYDNIDMVDICENILGFSLTQSTHRYFPSSTPIHEAFNRWIQELYGEKCIGIYDKKNKECIMKIKKEMKESYEEFLQHVLSKNKQEKEAFDKKYGQGRSFMADPQGKEAGFVDTFIQTPLLDIMREQANQHKFPSYNLNYITL